MLAAATGELTSGYGTYLLQTTLALVAVAAVAALVLRLLRRRGPARGLRLVAQLSLDGRRTVYVVEAAGRFLLLGAGGGDGALTMLAELDAQNVAALEQAEATAPGLGDLVRRLVGKKPGP